jgi:hypothetical protein
MLVRMERKRMSKDAHVVRKKKCQAGNGTWVSDERRAVFEVEPHTFPRDELVGSAMELENVGVVKSKLG